VSYVVIPDMPPIDSINHVRDAICILCREMERFSFFEHVDTISQESVEYILRKLLDQAVANDVIDRYTYQSEPQYDDCLFKICITMNRGIVKYRAAISLGENVRSFEFF